MNQQTDQTDIDDLVVTVKHFISEPKYRVQLDDLLGTETDALLGKIGNAELSVHGRWDPREFTTRVAIYERTTERLARTLGILGRWGDGSELCDVLNILSFTHRSLLEPRSGMTIWLNLRLYPVILLVATYGVALTRSERWSSIHRLLSASIGGDTQKPTRVVDDLNVSSWEANDNRIWQSLEGVDQQKTPLSDHVCRVLDSWKTSHMGLVPSFEQLFDLWDVLASLVFAERFSVTDATNHDTNDGMHRWTPLGRVGWRTQSRLQTLYRVQHELSTPLLRAGFFNGNRDDLTEAVHNIAVTANRFMW